MDQIIHENVNTTDKAQFHKFLRSYVRDHKKQQPQKDATFRTINRKPNPHFLKIPSPKMHLSSQHHVHPRKLRLNKRYSYPTGSHNYKHLAV